MKKTYIIPGCKCTEIETFELIAESLTVNNDPIESEDDILVKGERPAERGNLWDNEW